MSAWAEYMARVITCEMDSRGLDSGVPYTDEQYAEIKSLIDSGRLLEAQRMMLRIQHEGKTDP